jgi:hypothetical protein
MIHAFSIIHGCFELSINLSMQLPVADILTKSSLQYYYRKLAKNQGGKNAENCLSFYTV